MNDDQFADQILQEPPEAGEERLATEQEVRNLAEELFERTGGTLLIEREIPKYFELVDVGGLQDDGAVFATVRFVGPPVERGKEPLGDGGFTMTFKVKGDEVAIVDWLGE